MKSKINLLIEKNIILNYQEKNFRIGKQIFDNKGNYYLLIFSTNIDFIKYSIHSKRDGKVQTHFKYKQKEESRDQYFGGTINSFDDITPYQLKELANFSINISTVSELEFREKIEDKDIVLNLTQTENWGGKFNANFCIETIPNIKYDEWIEYFELRYTKFRGSHFSKLLFDYVIEKLPNKINLAYSIKAIPDLTHNSRIAEIEFTERTGIFDSELKAKERKKNEIVNETNNHSIWIDKTSIIPGICKELSEVCDQLNTIHRKKDFKNQDWEDVKTLEVLFFDLTFKLMNNTNLSSFKSDSIGK